MVKHIVMWKVRDEYEGMCKAECIEKAMNGLTSLVGKVPSLIDAEVGANFNESEMAFDMVLYTTFNDREGLDEYQNHPEHLNVARFVRSIAIERHVVDYYIN